MLLTNQWVNEEIKEKIKNHLEINENEKHCSKVDGKSVLRGKFIAYLKKKAYKQSNFTPKGTRKKKNKAQS